MLPEWLRTLRDEHIVGAVRRDPRSRGRTPLLGVDFDTAIRDVVGWGQADFDAPWSDPRFPRLTLSGPDRALLYAFTNMKGHLAELIDLLSQLARESAELRQELPIVIDLGCGPGTGLFAAAHALHPRARFTYIGLDRAASMLDLGRTLAAAPEARRPLAGIECHWAHTIADVRHTEPPGWRPVIVLASFLFASPTVRPRPLLDDIMRWIEPVSYGGAAVVYSNATSKHANRKYAAARQTLIDHGFSEHISDAGRVDDNGRDRALTYALFTRPRRIHYAV